MQVLRHIPKQLPPPAALTIGNFDGMHLGHQAILRALREQAEARGLEPCVMTFEPHPREYFAPHDAPARLTSQREKLEQFAAAGIARVYLIRFDAAFAGIDVDGFIRTILHPLHARLVQVGMDFRFGRGRAGSVADLQAAGFEVVSLPDVTVDGHRVSSTEIRRALAEGRLEDAAQLLGRPYSMSGHVVHGDKLGRELGYPTANIYMQHERPPLFGIYAVKLAGLGEAPLPGVASLGVRPTMKHNGQPTLEVHLFDFDGDLYGRHVQVQFLKKLRDEAKFPSLEALQVQMAADAAAARAYLKNPA